jgi:multisubunit Na+/H+ antiporter MnhG subunit
MKTNQMAKKEKIQKSGTTAATGYIIGSVNWQAWLNIILLFITFEIAVLSIEKAQWIHPQPSLTLTLILAMLVTLLLIRSSLHSALKHSLVILIGLLLTLWQAQGLMSAPDIFSRVNQAITALAAAGTERTLFAVFLVLVTWIFSYISTWFLVRKRNPWVGASLGALVILVNLSNLTDSYFYYLYLYLIAAVLLIAHTRIIRRPDPAGYSRRGWMFAGAVLLCIAVLAGSLARITPELRIPQLQTFIATHTLWKQGVEASRFNIFNSVPSKQAISTSGTHMEQGFAEEWHQRENINFIVRSARPSYWRVHAYDTYTAGGWENSPASDQLLGENTLWDEKAGTSGLPSLTYKVNTNLKTDIVLLAGNFIFSNNPTLVQVFAVCRGTGC